MKCLNFERITRFFWCGVFKKEGIKEERADFNGKKLILKWKMRFFFVRACTSSWRKGFVVFVVWKTQRKTLKVRELKMEMISNYKMGQFCGIIMLWVFIILWNFLFCFGVRIRQLLFFYGGCISALFIYYYYGVIYFCLKDTFIYIYYG